MIETLRKKCEVIPEESPAEDHQANGEIENAIQELEKQIKVLKLGLEQKMQLVLKDDNPSWLGFRTTPDPSEAVFKWQPTERLPTKS